MELKLKFKDMNLEQRREYTRVKIKHWRENNREKDLKSKKKWRDENKEYKNQQDLVYHLKNNERVILCIKCHRQLHRKT